MRKDVRVYLRPHKFSVAHVPSPQADLSQITHCKAPTCQAAWEPEDRQERRWGRGGSGGSPPPSPLAPAFPLPFPQEQISRKPSGWPGPTADCRRWHEGLVVAMATT